MLARALERTAHLWPEAQPGASWVQSASAILANNDGLHANLVELNYYDWIVQLEDQCSDTGLPSSMPQAASHFVKVLIAMEKICSTATELMPATHKQRTVASHRKSAVPRAARQRPKGRFAITGTWWLCSNGRIGTYPKAYRDAENIVRRASHPLAS